MKQSSNYEAAHNLLHGQITEDDLTEAQWEYWKRIRFSYKMMIEVRGNADIIQQLMKVFKLSHTQAWRALRDTGRLYGDFKKADKEFKRHIAEEMAKESYRIAKASGDSKAMTAATRAYIDASGVSIEDPDLPDFDKLQPSLIVTVLPEGMESSILQLLQGGLVNLNKLPETIDISHEEA